MIQSFLDKETEKIFYQEYSKRIPRSIQRIALRKLLMIDYAESLSDLRVPPANHLEKLTGDREGQWSIRINNQWRIVFIPSDDGADYFKVGIVDYHQMGDMLWRIFQHQQ